MGRIPIFLVLLIVSIYLASCTNSSEQNFYGIYTFEKVNYLSPLSSATSDYVNHQMEGRRYILGLMGWNHGI